MCMPHLILPIRRKSPIPVLDGFLNISLFTTLPNPHEIVNHFHSTNPVNDNSIYRTRANQRPSKSCLSAPRSCLNLSFWLKRQYVKRVRALRIKGFPEISIRFLMLDIASGRLCSLSLPSIRAYLLSCRGQQKEVLEWILTNKSPHGKEEKVM